MAITPLQVFIIYAREDEPFRAELKAQLRPMERAGLLQVWTDRELVAGEYWEPAIKNQLQKADIILLLVSSNYFQSDYIHEVEIKEALVRHARGEAHVIPIIVRPCDWESDPVIRFLQALPTDGVPVNDIRYWHTREAAWVDVVRGIQRTLKQFQGERTENEIKLAQLEDEKTRAHKIVEQQARMAEDEAKRKEAENAYRRAEYSAWPNALHIGTVEAFQTYIATYPTGAYVREARQRIKHLQRSNNVMYPWRTVAWLGALLALVIVVIFWPQKTNSGPANPTESPNIPSNTSVKRGTPNNPKTSVAKPIPQKENTQKIPTDNDDDDNDGIPNKDDKCPDKKGTSALEGCPEEEPVFYPKGGGSGEGISLDNNVITGGGIAGRKVVNRPKMINDTQNTGRVVVSVCINEEGEVTSARYTMKGSTTLNLALRKRAELWARNYQFVASDKAECGTITFDFLVR